MSPRRRPAGHRTLPHTADAQVEAWAPTRDECLRELVLGSVEIFLDITGASSTGAHVFHAEAGEDDRELVIAILEEMVFLLDTRGTVPVQVTVTSDDGGCDVRFDTVQAHTLTQLGAVPKAVSLHDLRFRGDDGGWSGLVTWDV